MSDGSAIGKHRPAASHDLETKEGRHLSDSKSALPKPVLSAVEAVEDLEDRERLFGLFIVAARAMDRLSDIDLSSFEPSADATADLAAWEEVAPFIGETMAEVNELLSAIEETIPDPDADTDDDFDLFGEGTENDTEPEANGEKDCDSESRVIAAYSAIHGIAILLRREVATFGASIRKPEVVADRWNLIDHIEAFRGRFKAGIGELVFAATSNLIDVEKDKVIPGYRGEVDRSVGLRRALTLLSARVVQESSLAEEEERKSTAIRQRAHDVLKLLDRFMSSKAWTTVRAADRRSFIDLRCSLAEALEEGSCSASHETLEGLARFLESLYVINQREVLIAHDRSALPALSDTARATMRAAAEKNDERARKLLASALRLGWRLVGRDPDLDDIVVRAQRMQVESLDCEDIALWAETIAKRVTSVPVP